MFKWYLLLQTCVYVPTTHMSLFHVPLANWVTVLRWVDKYATKNNRFVVDQQESMNYSHPSTIFYLDLCFDEIWNSFSKVQIDGILRYSKIFRVFCLKLIGVLNTKHRATSWWNPMKWKPNNVVLCFYFRLDFWPLRVP